MSTYKQTQSIIFRHSQRAGASPISAEVMMFLRVCFGCHVLEGYGMTETACTITITRTDDPTIGHVGAPLPCCEIKLVDIPEMNYMTTDQPHPRCVV
jgi:long-chain acyl-CoA synthetase